MALPRVSDNKLVRVSGGPIELRVKVGNRMAGGTSVLLNGRTVELRGEEPITLAEDASRVKFDTLHCVTHVKDTNPLSDTTAVSYFIRDGQGEQEFPYTLVLKQGESIAQYLIDFTFV